MILWAWLDLTNYCTNEDSSARHLQGRLPLGYRASLRTENVMDEVDIRVGAGECHSDT